MTAYAASPWSTESTDVVIVDSREDPRLVKAFAPYDVPVEVLRLDYGDLALAGNGPRGAVLIGVERKRIGDLVASMLDRRLSGHQLRGMWSAYDYVEVVVEGIWRPATDGSIEVCEGGRWRSMFHRRQGVSYQQVAAYLTSLTFKGNVVVHRSQSVYETAALVAAEWHWWQKRWQDHHSDDVIYADGPSKRNQGGKRGRAIEVYREPGLVEKVAAQLPGVDRRAWNVGDRFKSVYEMVTAGANEWVEVDGIGRPSARKIVAAIRGESNGEHTGNIRR